MNSPEISLGTVANIFSRQMHFVKAGDVEHGHTHNFDHLTLLAHGSVKAVVDGKETVFKAPHMIYIRADVVHEFTALEDNTVAFCIHAVRDEAGVLIDPSMIPNGVTLAEASKGITKRVFP